MKNKTYLRGLRPCGVCSFTQKLILLEMLETKRNLQLLMAQSQLEKERGMLRDAHYVMEFVGISAETLFRRQKDGQISVAKRIRSKRFYYDSDVRRFFLIYHGRMP